MYVVQSQTTTTTFDGQLQALNHVTRRRLLHALLREQVDTVDVERYDDFETNAIEMHHVHLPKLEELGYVSDDPRENHVQRGPRFDEIVPLLELLDSHDEKLPVEWL